jgi:hypothetical protein
MRYFNSSDSPRISSSDSAVSRDYRNKGLFATSRNVTSGKNGGLRTIHDTWCLVKRKEATIDV